MSHPQSFRLILQAVCLSRGMLDGASIDVVSPGITVSTGSVSEPAGNNVDVKV